MSFSRDAVLCGNWRATFEVSWIIRNQKLRIKFFTKIKNQESFKPTSTLYNNHDALDIDIDTDSTSSSNNNKNKPKLEHRNTKWCIECIASIILKIISAIGWIEWIFNVALLWSNYSLEKY